MNTNHLSKKEKNDILLSIIDDFKIYTSLPESIKEDFDIALTALRVALDDTTDSSDNDLKLMTLFLQVPLALREDKQFIVNLFDSLNPFLREGAGIVPRIKKDFLSDKKLVLSILNTYPCALSFASTELKDDNEIVQVAVRNSQYALEAASERLKNDRKIHAIIICYSSVWMIKDIPDSIKDVELIREIYAISPSKVVNLKSSGMVKELATIIDEALSAPQQSQSFYLKEMEKVDEKMSALEASVAGPNFVSSPTMTSNMKEAKMSSFNYSSRVNLELMEHLASHLSLAELRTLDCKSRMLKEQFIMRLELLAIEQKDNGQKVKSKKPRKLVRK